MSDDEIFNLPRGGEAQERRNEAHREAWRAIWVANVVVRLADGGSRLAGVSESFNTCLFQSRNSAGSGLGRTLDGLQAVGQCFLHADDFGL